MRKHLLCLLAIIIAAMPYMAHSQSRTISGTIKDENGAALPAVTVIQKGTNNGTVTNEEGAYSITVNGARPVLVFSYAGRQTQEVVVGAANNYNVSLRTAGDMSEVVVTALGITREKRSLGYSAQEVSGAALTQTKQTNIVNALRGQVAGVQINSGGGAPGQGTRIIIRGIKSLDPGKDNQPLFVIDGVIMDNSTSTVSTSGALRGLSNRAADINPDDVESISVLRGGAATALYGQAGSNGVVIITTKTAKAGKMRVGFTTSYGIDEVNKFPEVQNKFSQGFVGATSRVPEYDPNTIFSGWGPTVEEVKRIDPTQNDFLYNHYGRGYKRGDQFRASLNLSGGTENALLTSSFSYFKQNGTIPNSDYQNISARFGGQFKFGNKLRISPSFNFINSGGLRVNADRFNEQLSYWSPRLDVRDYIKPDGTMKGYRDNPIYGTSINNFRDNVNRLIGNVGVTFSPIKWFDLDYKLGMDYTADFRRHTGRGPLGLVGELHFADNGLGFVDEFRISNRIINSNLIGTFKKDWGTKFNTVLRVGNDVRMAKYNRLTASGSELDVPTLLSLNNAKVRTTSQYLEDYRIVSAFGDLTLEYDNFLFLNVTGRNDWSSTLDPEFNSFFYPSVSLSYVFTDHLKRPDWFSFGKLRASYAEIGKDASPYDNNSYYGSSVITTTSQIAWTRGDARGDRLLKPERTSTIELGTELRFLKNRVGIDFTWYKLNSRNQIIPVFISPTAGFTSIITNAGEVENKGIEIVLNGSPVKTKDFTWDATLNFSRNRNEVVKIIEGLKEIVVASNFGYINSGVTLKYVPGFPVGNLYGTTLQRYYGTKTDDKVTFQPGLPLVIASTGTNAGFPVPDLAQRILGNSQPKWMGGFTNTFTYKSLRLSFLLETQQGQYKHNQLANFMAAFGIAKYTEDRTTSKVFDGVLANGTPNTQLVYLGMGRAPAPDTRDYGNGYYRNIYRTVSENFVEDASWTRLRNLSLSYTLPARWLKTNLIKEATLTFTGNNLVLWTNYSGFDPETSSSPAGSNADGFTGFSYPAMRSYLFSINVNF